MACLVTKTVLLPEKGLWNWAVWMGRGNDQIVICRPDTARLCKRKATAESAAMTWTTRISEGHRASMRVDYLWGPEGWIWELWVRKARIVVGKKTDHRYANRESAECAARRWAKRLNIQIVPKDLLNEPT